MQIRGKCSRRASEASSHNNRQCNVEGMLFPFPEVLVQQLLLLPPCWGDTKAQNRTGVERCRMDLRGCQVKRALNSWALLARVKQTDSARAWPEPLPGQNIQAWTPRAPWGSRSCHPPLLRWHHVGSGGFLSHLLLLCLSASTWNMERRRQHRHLDSVEFKSKSLL